LSQSNPEIIKTLNGMEQEAKDFKKRLLELCWYMRGGLAFNEVMQMGVNDLGLINDIIKDNLETTKKSGMPFF
jgi:hypothetical protein|tara:strand:+ start:627 stop:845 length:219 start_codon:yes stop_codon:yes gene_type:complete